MVERVSVQGATSSLESPCTYLFGFVPTGEAERETRRVGNGLDFEFAPAGSVTGIVRRAARAGTERSTSRTSHFEVLSSMSVFSSVVPAPPGTSFGAERSVREFTRRHRDVLSDEIERLGGSVEFGLRAQWDVENCFDFLTERHGRLAEARGETGTHDEQGAAGAAVRVSRQYASALRREREKFDDALRRELTGVCREFCTRPCANESQLVELRCRVEGGDVGPFECAVYDLAEQFAEHVAFEFGRPLPPLTFVDETVIDLLRTHR